MGIIGLLPSGIPIHMYKGLKDYFIKDPFQMATAMMGYLTTHCDYLIALAHLNHAEIESFAQKVPKISIIIGGHNQSYMDAKMVNRSLWVQTDAFGFQIGRLDVRWVKGPPIFSTRMF